MAAGSLGNWKLDITDGVLKDHDLSSEILHAAYEKCRAIEFVKTVPFGKNRGQSVTVPRVHAITEPESAELEEQQGIPEDTFTISGTKITVTEYARTLPYTSLEEELLSFDLEVELQDLLLEQMTLILDSCSIAAFKLAKIYATLTNATTISFATGGAPTAVAGAELNAFGIQEIVKYLIETLYAPPYDEDYICIARYRSLLNIRDTGSPWEKWHQYLTPEDKFNGEVGRFERTRFVETNHSRALKNMGPAGAYTQALFFGKDAVAMAESTPFELRAGIPTDLGRKKVVGWYGVAGWNIRWETANPREARVVVLDGLAA